jgi:hypothetical protein
MNGGSKYHLPNKLKWTSMSVVPPVWRKQILAPIYALCISFVFVLLFSITLRQPEKTPDPGVPTSSPPVQSTPPTTDVNPTASTSPPPQNSPKTVIRAKVVDTSQLHDVAIQVWDGNKQIRKDKLDASGSFKTDVELDGLSVCIKAPNGYQVIGAGPARTDDGLSCTKPILAAPDEGVVELSKSE